MSSAFRDPDFQVKLIAFICRDRKFLKNCFHLLDPDDFKPRKNDGPERWIIASTALEYYRKYRDKIGDLLRSEMLDFARKNKYGDSQRKELLRVVKEIQELKLNGADHMESKVVEYKSEQLKMSALEELMNLQESGELTNDAWINICQKAVESNGHSGFETTDYFTDESFELRQARRGKQVTRKFPLLFIDPLDESIRVVSWGHLGLVMAPYKKGKSLMLAHIALAYALQGLRVLFFTLEDPQPDVEDRLDAMISFLPLKRLHDMPVKLRNRFEQYRRLVRGRLKIVDGTEGGMSVRKIIEVCERERNQGFIVDAVIVDYDDEIVPAQKRKERRHEFADIYRDFGQFLRKNRLIGWLAAQTVRKTENKKVISGDTIAEDISKMRKVTCGLGIGQGDWGDESLYLYVAVHKHDKQHIGWNIMANRNRMVFYDRDATKEMIKKELNAVREDAGEEVDV